MTISTLRNDTNKASNLIYYVLGVIGIGLLVFWGGQAIKNMGSLGGNAGLSVESANQEADVYVNGEILGKAPIEVKDIKPGENKITLKSATRQYQTTIKFLGSSKDFFHIVGIIRDLGVSDIFSSGQDFWFEKDVSETTIRIISEPAGAKVSVDGTELGETPFSSSSITKGAYEIKVSKAGYETQTARINIEDGYTLNASLKLFPLPIAQSVDKFSDSDLYGIVLDNGMITSDTEAWAKAVVYWNGTRGINLEGTGNNTERVFDYLIDYRGNIFDKDANLVTSKDALGSLKEAKRGAYLGRVSDGEGITTAAKEALLTLKEISGMGSTATVKATPTGWLRVRSAPNLSGQEVSRVDVGETYPVLEKQTGWVKIQASDTVQGWVSADYITLSE